MVKGYYVSAKMIHRKDWLQNLELYLARKFCFPSLKTKRKFCSPYALIIYMQSLLRVSNIYRSLLEIEQTKYVHILSQADNW